MRSEPIPLRKRGMKNVAHQLGGRRREIDWDFQRLYSACRNRVLRDWDNYGIYAGNLPYSHPGGNSDRDYQQPARVQKDQEGIEERGFGIVDHEGAPTGVALRDYQTYDPAYWNRRLFCRRRGIVLPNHLFRRLLTSWCIRTPRGFDAYTVLCRVRARPRMRRP